MLCHIYLFWVDVKLPQGLKNGATVANKVIVIFVLVCGWQLKMKQFIPRVQHVNYSFALSNLHMRYSGITNFRDLETIVALWICCWHARVFHKRGLNRWSASTSKFRSKHGLLYFVSDVTYLLKLRMPPSPPSPLSCIWVNLKNVGPPFFEFYMSVYIKISFTQRENRRPQGLSCYVALILQMKDSCSATEFDV